MESTSAVQDSAPLLVGEQGDAVGVTFPDDQGLQLAHLDEAGAQFIVTSPPRMTMPSVSVSAQSTWTTTPLDVVLAGHLAAFLLGADVQRLGAEPRGPRPAPMFSPPARGSGRAVAFLCSSWSDGPRGTAALDQRAGGAAVGAADGRRGCRGRADRGSERRRDPEPGADARRGRSRQPGGGVRRPRAGDGAVFADIPPGATVELPPGAVWPTGARGRWSGQARR